MPKLAFLFPGQGAQYVGMAQALCDSLPAARKLFDEAAGILGYDLLDVCAKGPKEKLDSTAVSQPAIYVASLAALESLRAKEPGVEADCIATAGLSLGEYTALAFADVLSFADGLKLVQIRGTAMQAASDATPTAIPRVVNEFRSTASRKLRAANSVRSRNFIAGSLGHQFSVAHGNNPVRITRRAHFIVCHHNNGHLQVAIYFL